MKILNLDIATGYLKSLLAMGVWPWLTSMMLGVVAFLFPSPEIADLALLAGGAIVIDTLTGMRAARVKGHRISSSGFGRVLDKSLGYLALVAVTAYIDRYIPGLDADFLAAISWLPESLSKLNHLPVATVIFAVTIKEIISILENVEAMKVWLPPGLMPLIRKFLNVPASITPPK